MSRSHKIVGTRDWEQDIYQHVAAHGQLEGEILREYKELADHEQTSPAFSYLARMILDDEVRHHRIFDELAETFRQMVADTPDRSPIPSLRGFHADRVRIQRVTERLLEVERDDLRDTARAILRRYSAES